MKRKRYGVYGSYTPWVKQFIFKLRKCVKCGNKMRFKSVYYRNDTNENIVSCQKCYLEWVRNMLNRDK